MVNDLFFYSFICPLLFIPLIILKCVLKIVGTAKSNAIDVKHVIDEYFIQD